MKKLKKALSLSLALALFLALALPAASAANSVTLDASGESFSDKITLSDVISEEDFTLRRREYHLYHLSADATITYESTVEQYHPGYYYYPAYYYIEPTILSDVYEFAGREVGNLLDLGGYFTVTQADIKEMFEEFEILRISISHGDTMGQPISIYVVFDGESAAPSAPAEPEQPTTPSAPATPPAGNVVLSPQRLTVDGNSVECEKYNINGSNYFKLRDLAYALNGTGSQFGVGYDEATATVTITTGEAYTPTGTEMATGVDNSSTAHPSSQTIKINGVEHGELTVYNIGGSNFFQLRELGNVLGFDVDYDGSTNTAIVRSK